MPIIDSFSLDGRRALVTGGNRGLGKAFTIALAEAGARVVFVARDAERNAAAVAELAAAGLEVQAIVGDIADSEQIARIVDEATTALGGGIDILVNNAGACFHNDAHHVSDEEWDTVFDLNVKAMFRLSVAVSDVMEASGGGSIVNIGSMSGLIVNRPQLQLPYNASKAAVHHMTKSLASEWAARGIRVNALAPGYVKTEMAPVDRPDLRRYWIEDAPMQRYAMPEEIAPSVVFLASEASSFITGTVLVADGGFTVW
jgi:NAD(P)-dependent dehydrogenase (short-subunit alcohol dehydrogenase family)